MKRAWTVMAAVWIGITILGEAAVFALHFYPPAYSHEAAVVDDAFTLLAALAVPVFGFVVAMLVTSALHFRAGNAEQDGPHQQASKKVLIAWFSITGALCVLLVINPGLKGLHDIRGESRADYVVDVTGQRWSWTIRYPGEVVVQHDAEVVLPADARVRFDVHATDVVHSFWVPAFRMKIDAVPNRTTHAYVSIDRVGSYKDATALRLQCAELCGLSHAKMMLPVRVLPRAEFDKWLARQRAAASATTTTAA